ncbi:STAS/SEC14 domain-containing protein [Salinimicrobium soli]|uniref:STAS/SEC14 domain-containing protein n=1 Tax=Salinimicrobium soli TaxID=1254399 RepID=UPI003AAF7A61
MEKEIMVRIEEHENILYTIAEEKLEDEDYNRIIPLLEAKIKTYGLVRWYFEMKNFKGWSLSALWKDLKVDFKNRNKYEKVAMVGDKEWEEKLTDLMKPFTDADVKYFPLSEAEKARNWIKNP